MQYWTALLLGFLGSLHCAGMCGPLALALPGNPNNKRSFVLGRLAYNTGRLLTYSILGVIFGIVGKSLFTLGFQRGLSLLLGVALIASIFASRLSVFSAPISRLVTWPKFPMSALLKSRSSAALAGLGMLNGLLPCGLVYVACASATTRGDIPGAALYMALFGLGTFPMMLGISMSGRLFPLSFRLRIQKAIPVTVFILGALLILRGMALRILYLSPDLAAGVCCQK